MLSFRSLEYCFGKGHRATAQLSPEMAGETGILARFSKIYCGGTPSGAAPPVLGREVAAATAALLSSGVTK